MAAALGVAFAALAAPEDMRHAAVMAMQPIGYWPADEGEGAVLHDRSGNGNDGSIFQVPWRDGLLHFTSAYQWLEIPNHPGYQGAAFSLGGWVFVRDTVHGGPWGADDGFVFFGNAYHTSGRNLGRLYDLRVLHGKSEWGIRGGTEAGVLLCVRGNRTKGATRNQPLLDVISGGQVDALGSLEAKIGFAPGTWHHVLYTFDSWTDVGGGKAWRESLERQQYKGDTGTARLYVDGKPAAEATDVPFTPRDKPYLVGPDAVWWLQAVRSGSLNGSVRDLVIFDRALSAVEIERLVGASRPAIVPVMTADPVMSQADAIEADVVNADGLSVDVAELPAASGEACRRVFASLLGQWRRDRNALKGREADLLPGVTAALDKPAAQPLAVELLLALGNDEARAAVAAAVPSFTGIIRDSSRPREERAAATLAIARAGGLAKSAAPVLIEELGQILATEGVRLPRVEDLWRNALILALLQTARNDPAARVVLSDAIAKPALALHHLDAPELAEIRALADAGRYMDALDAFCALPAGQRGPAFFSQGDPNWDARPWIPNVRAYTAIATDGRNTYDVGMENAVEYVTPEVAKEIMTACGATGWREPDYPHLFRLKIHKKSADGKTETAYLEGENFLIDGRDGKVRGWSIAVDTDGYLHLCGGMHNSPGAGNYMPGGWEKMGAATDYTSDEYPSMLYWVSERPGDITSFTFVGQRANPRNIATPEGLNYMNWLKDRNGELYVYGRIFVQGLQSWGLYRYDTSARRWSVVGAAAPDTKREFPTWADKLIEMAGDGMVLPTMRFKAADSRNWALAWARQPHFYNFIRDNFAFKFDPANRLHAQVGLFGFNEHNQSRNLTMYAWSDDGGRTFHRADGTPVALPLSVTPGPNDASLNIDGNGMWWNLYRDVLREAGFHWHPLPEEK